MQLLQVDFTNWKSYRIGRFQFDQTTPSRHVTLIGAMNGSGKTTFLEGLLVGLHGIRGYEQLSTKSKSRRDEAHPDAAREQPYNAFIAGAFNSAARSAGETGMTIRLTWLVQSETGAPEVLRTTRSWHLNTRTNGFEEELRIETGPSELDLEFLHPPALEAMANPQSYKERYLARRTLPASMAGFCFFDGEKLERFAQQSIGDQLSNAIGEFFGVSLVARFKDTVDGILSDPQNAPGRRISVDPISRRLEEQQAELQRLTTEDGDIGARIDQLEAELSSWDTELERFMKASGKLPQDLRNEKRLAEQNRLGQVKALYGAIDGALPLALAAGATGQRLVEHLQQDNKIELWESEVKASANTISSFLDQLRRDIKDSQPTLTAEERDGIIDWVSRSWESYHHPRPADLPRQKHHDYLSRQQRDALLRSAGRLTNGVRQALDEKLENIRLHAKQIEELELQLSEFEGIVDDERLRTLKDRAKAAREEQRELEARKQWIGNELAARISEFENQQRTLRRREESDKNQLVEEKRELLAVTTWLRDRVDLLHRHLLAHYQRQLSIYIQEAYTAMAHKGVAQTVRLEGGALSMYDEGGMNLIARAPSAGERQVFGMAVVAALHLMMKTKAPIIIDTPMGRLDSHHRMKLVSWLCEKTGAAQVIFLSTDEEMVGERKRQLDPHLLNTFRVEYSNAQSVIYPGVYF